MKRFFLLITGALCLSSWLAHAGREMTVHVGRLQPAFVVKLPANPTTGYQWQVTQFDKSLLTLISQHYVAPKPQIMGAGGDCLFTFQLRQGKPYPKSTAMVFTYARSWEPSSAMLTKVTVKFGE